jgi:hypothetical protein
VLEGECAAVLKGFFKERRRENKDARDSRDAGEPGGREA